MNAGLLMSAALLTSLASSTLVSEDLACISAGVLVADGRMSFLFATLACFTGIFLGDILLFAIGRWVGRPALSRAPLCWVMPMGSLDAASKWLSSNGFVAIAASRFVPGTRLPTYVAAGALHTSARKFLSYFFIAAAVWTPLLVALSVGLGMPLMHLGFLSHRRLWVQLLLAGAGIFLIIGLIRKLATYRGRRAVVRSWKRLYRWEFWPPYIFYPPVILYIAYFGIRFRSLTLFTAANPAMAAGGFIGESKYEILEQLRGAREWMPGCTLLAPGEIAQRVARTEEFMRKNALTFPVVLKPDAGQRGSGVNIVRSSAQLGEYLSNASYPAILQEYIPGEEFGVFYYRYPGAEHGRIFSITEKRMPILVGDGKRTLEELILADDRAVCMADFYLRKNSERTQCVPAVGENVQLVEIRTHCRGAIFLDGSDAITPALEDTIDQIARCFDGFFFGRFDIRVPSRQDLMAGRDLKVIELNGVTSEATHIYDPKLSLFEAYTVLFRQWRIAFEIGDLNRARGIRPTPMRELFQAIRAYRRLAEGYPS